MDNEVKYDPKSGLYEITTNLRSELLSSNLFRGLITDCSRLGPKSVSPYGKNIFGPVYVSPHGIVGAVICEVKDEDWQSLLEIFALGIPEAILLGMHPNLLKKFEKTFFGGREFFYEQRLLEYNDHGDLRFWELNFNGVIYGPGRDFERDYRKNRSNVKKVEKFLIKEIPDLPILFNPCNEPMD